ncbi:MAG TPA: ABC transporter ATP-binding protein [Bacillota bacterium]|nr:ABC transporter ATP-binding protein [Bacillota bacterium]
MLLIENLVKKYGKFTAVDKLNLKLDKGDIYGFIGPNGAGKTTTMKVVATLMKATSGKVFVDGIDVAENPRMVKSRIGYMPDFFGVYDNLKVNEYMDFYGSCYGIPAGERRKARGELLELVDLKDKGDNYVDTLSRGMKQRLCLARSLIHNPELLILDEPASGMDPRARIEMKGILKTLKSMDKTILISSHILHELAELCNTIGVIEQGELVYSGKIDDLMKRLTGKSIIRIRVLADVDRTASLLKEQPYIDDISGEDNTLEISYDGGEEDMTRLLKLLVLNDIPVISFTKIDGNIEKVFLEVTKGGAKELK